MIHRSLLLKLFRRLTELFVLAETCCLDYAVTFLCVTEPPEERMEQALFSPPLSKQRLEYAVQHIKKSCATTLVILIPLLTFSASSLLPLVLCSHLSMLCLCATGWLWLWIWKFIGLFIGLPNFFGKNCWYWHITKES